MLKPKFFKSRKCLVLSLFVLCSGLLWVAPPVRANVLNLFNQFFLFSSKRWIDNGSTALDLNTEALPPAAQQQLEDHMNQAGSRRIVPDHELLRGEVQNQVAIGESSNPLAINSNAAAEAAGNAFDRNVTRAHASQELSQDGQRKARQKLEVTAQLIKDLQLKANEGQQFEVTQDVMKQLLLIQARQTEVLGLARMDALESRLDSKYANLNLTNISRTLDTMANTEQNEAAASAGELFELTNQANTLNNF